ncbi:unnamed protein product, partial [Amoebophrya sp. A25]
DVDQRPSNTKTYREAALQNNKTLKHHHAEVCNIYTEAHLSKYLALEVGLTLSSPLHWRSDHRSRCRRPRKRNFKSHYTTPNTTSV